MVHSTTLLAAAAASLLFSLPASADGIYTKNSPVLQVDARSYDKLIAQSNHTSMLEFYAPWCGHCQSLKPAYEKAAKNLKGLAKVAAINCDEEPNKPFCGSMGVQGFPTLKIIKPGKKAGKPVVEDYQGQRTAKAIVDAMVDKIPNHVNRVADKTLDEWLATGNDTAKAVLFSDKGTTSALLKALAIDFLGSISIAQIRDKDTKAVELFGISSYPTFVLLPGGDKEAVVYDGEMKKEPMSAFLAQVAPPNPDPAPAVPKAAKNSSGKNTKKASKDSSSFSSASASHSSADASSAKATATAETLEQASNPTESPSPNVVSEDDPKPVPVPNIGTLLQMLETEEQLQQACLTSKSHICILTLLPAKRDPAAPLSEDVQTALKSLGEISAKHKRWSFFTLPASNPGASALRTSLSLVADSDVEVLAINARKAWYKRYVRTSFTRDAVDDWVDSVKMGEGKKETLPESLVVPAPAAATTAKVKEEPEVREIKLDGKNTKGDEPFKVEFMEEISDEEVERLMREAEQGARAREGGNAHDEL
ncbi:hypothetical protein B0A49_07984 [Cryomyces minteri]|uniref:protein disulfide-isomerase n=1 Tax=Cryomyces minteri TaxID=331657 RepID=A0A4U0WMD5_9PEZI|nr:hypothetical protein B0A49_07984 [Cryomyces minteri]